MTSAQPPGWFPDPAGRHEFRWWSGADWTEHVADDGQAHRDPLPEAWPDSGPGTGGQDTVPRHPFDAVMEPAVKGGRAAPHPVANWVHAGLVLVSCGIWAAVLPSVLLWRRQSRPAAVLAAVVSAGLVLGLALMVAPDRQVAAPRYTLSPQDRSRATGGPTPLVTVTPSVTGSPAPGVTPVPAVTMGPGGTIQPVVGVPPTRAPKPQPATPRPVPTLARPTPGPVATTQAPPPPEPEPEPEPEPAPKDYANCDELNADYPHGVGRSGATDETRDDSPPVTTFTVDTAVYEANAESDRDGDGVACEQA